LSEKPGQTSVSGPAVQSAVMRRLVGRMSAVVGRTHHESRRHYCAADRGTRRKQWGRWEHALQSLLRRPTHRLVARSSGDVV